jgi:hypothetical protein
MQAADEAIPQYIFRRTMDGFNSNGYDWYN